MGFELFHCCACHADIVLRKEREIEWLRWVDVDQFAFVHRSPC